MRVATLVVSSVLIAGVAFAQTGPIFLPGGGPWAPLTPLAVSPAGEIFASAGDPGDAGTLGALYVSSDGGRSWALRAPGLQARSVAFTPGAVWAATSVGVMRSSDGGATWTNALAGVSVDVAADGDRVVAVVNGTVRLLEGSNWSVLDVPLPSVGMRTATRVAVRDDRIAVGARDVSQFSTGGSLFVATLPVSTWTQGGCSGPPTSLTLTSDAAWMGCRDGVFINNNTEGGLLRMEGASASVLPVGPVHGLTTDVGGAVWYAAGDRVVRIPSDGTERSVPFAPAGPLVVLSPERVLVGTPSISIGYFPDGYSFMPAKGLYAVDPDRAVHTGAVPATVWSVHVDPDLGLLAGGDAGTVHRLDDDAWVPTAVSMSRVARILDIDGTPLAVGSPEPNPTPWGFGGGPAVQAVESGALPLPLSGTEVADVAWLGGTWFQATPGPDWSTQTPGLWRLSDSGGPAEVIIEGADLRVVTATSGGEAFAGAWGPSPSTPAAAHRLYRTADGGVTWAADDDGLAVDGVYCVLRTADGRTILGTSDGTAARVEPGPWTADGLQGLDVYDLVETSQGVVAATSDGLWWRDGGAGWTRNGSGLDGRTVFDLDVVDGPFPWLVAATDAGVWATQPLATVGDAPTPVQPVARLLAFPNPATTRLTLVERPGAVAEVFDAFGRRVARATLGANGRTTLDVAGLAAGVYLVRVAGGEPARVTVVR